MKNLNEQADDIFEAIKDRMKNDNFEVVGVESKMLTIDIDGLIIKVHIMDKHQTAQVIGAFFELVFFDYDERQQLYKILIKYIQPVKAELLAAEIAELQKELKTL